jgi:acyl carrier protein
MDNISKYKKSFVDALSIKEDIVNSKLEYNSIPEWDSIGHMSLIGALEDEFGISIDTDDIIDFSSFAKGKEILKKYEVEI